MHDEHLSVLSYCLLSLFMEHIFFRSDAQSWCVCLRPGKSGETFGGGGGGCGSGGGRGIDVYVLLPENGYFLEGERQPLTLERPPIRNHQLIGVHV